ncbi:MAG TPA: hypothetical protein VK025_03065 [Steroidobacter sp.]|jgi:VanZ family protein|nr:hypothetical protein [Steroidobacteraceae bacterium]HLS80365.1 hypothetical protein [Steroidobacter sp.]
MALPLRHARGWLAIGWALIALAVLLSLVPGQNLPPTGLSDKTHHAAAYALLALWFAGLYPRSRYLLIGLGLFTMGLAIEWAQGAMNLGRQGDYRDVIANCVGVVSGLAAAFTPLGGWAQRLESWMRRT